MTNTTRDARTPAEHRTRWHDVLPVLWIITLSLGLVFGISWWLLALLSIGWGAVFLSHRNRSMAAVASGIGVVLAILLFLLFG